MKARSPDDVVDELIELGRNSNFARSVIRMAKSMSIVGHCDIDPVEMIKGAEQTVRAYHIGGPYLGFMIKIFAAALTMSAESFTRAFDEASSNNEVDIELVHEIISAMKEKEYGSHTDQ